MIDVCLRSPHPKAQHCCQLKAADSDTSPATITALYVTHEAEITLMKAQRRLLSYFLRKHLTAALGEERKLSSIYFCGEEFASRTLNSAFHVKSQVRTCSYAVFLLAFFIIDLFVVVFEVRRLPAYMTLCLKTF